MHASDGRAHSQPPSLRDVFDGASPVATRMRFDAHQSIYVTGQDDDSLYVIDSGQVKVSVASADGKDCLFAIYTVGEVFGETCFAGNPRRVETATAMQPVVVRRVSRRDFVAHVEKIGALDALLRHMAERLIDRQTSVFDLITTGSELRLAKVLLAFAEKFGIADGSWLRLGPRISHEELSQIVGTTRPRVTKFMQNFRDAQLIETTGRAISVHRQRMQDFLARN
jgi:CRP/FNR family cyclic AMP-dependent transcriptional regulator